MGKISSAFKEKLDEKMQKAPLVESIPSQSTPYGVASSPEGELLLYSVQSLFFDMQNVSYPFLKLSLRESWRVSA